MCSVKPKAVEESLSFLGISNFGVNANLHRYTIASSLCLWWWTDDSVGVDGDGVGVDGDGVGVDGDGVGVLVLVWMVTVSV